MSTEFFNDQWRIPSNENQNKISNYSMEFDGTNTDIDLGTDVLFDSTKGFSVSAWINLENYNPNTFPNIVRLFTDQSDDFILSLSNQSGYTGVFFGSPSQFAKGRTTGNISGDFIGVWKHICLTFNGVDRTALSSYKIYVDGSSVALVSASAIGAATSLNSIGDGGGSTRHFNGKIDQVTIFDYELSQDQVTTLGAAEGYAFNFNGTNDSIQIPTNSNLEITGDMTISAWIKPDSSTATSTKIINKRDSGGTNYDFFIDTGGDKLKFYDGTSNTASTINITPDVWNHVAITILSGVTNGSIFYVNGIGQTSNLPTFTITSNDAPLTIGKSGQAPTAFFDGEISNVSIFNSSLSASNIITLYNNGSPAADISSLSPVGWWKLDDTATFNSGTSVWSIPDDSSNSSTGTSVGMNVSNLVLTNINGELVGNPMALSPKPIAYYQLGDQSAFNGANFLVPNNSLQDYVFDFDGDTQNINIDNEITLSSNHSVSFWLNFDVITSTSGAGPIPLSSSTNNYYPMIAIASGKIQLYIKGTAPSGFINKVTNTALIANTWYHIVVTSDGTTALYYINGGADSGEIGSARTGVSIKSIGSRLNGASRSLFVDGRMSNVAIWSGTTLTSSQVTTLYNNGSPPADISSLSPTAWYKLNAQDTFDGTDWTIKDSAGTNNGTSDEMTSASLVQGDLQHTSGYSPYALTLISTNAQQLLLNNGGNAILNGATSLTVSAWINPVDNNSFQNIFSNWGNNIIFRFSGDDKLEFFISGGGTTQSVQSGAIMKYGIWQHVAATYNGSLLKIFINGDEVQSKAATGTLGSTNTQDRIGNRPGQTQYFNGGISNVAIWKNSVIDINTLYNQGVPGDLSKLNPSVWWQLGSNSSFNSGLWTCLNEGTLGTTAEPLNATAQLANMTNDQITNGPGYSANGLGESTIDIIGDAPYSSGNGLSESMDVLDRVKDVPS